MMGDRSVSASMVLYQNEPRAVVHAIKSYLDCEKAGRLYVLDNSPTDKLCSLCVHPRIHYTFNGNNLGFGRAHNIALKAVLDQSTYHLILNPDVYFGPDVMAKLTAFMDRSPDVGLCMPRVNYPDGRLQPLCKLLPGPLQLITRRFFSFLPRFTRKLNYEYEMHFTGYDHITDVPFLSGCFMFLRTAALEKSGLFDEGYFLYAEDTDLSRKINRHFRTVFYPDAEIYHEHARGSYKSFRLMLHNIYGAIRYFNKWGWIHDTERVRINRAILRKYHVNGYASLKEHAAHKAPA